MLPAMVHRRDASGPGSVRSGNLPSPAGARRWATTTRASDASGPVECEPIRRSEIDAEGKDLALDGGREVWRPATPEEPS